MQLSDLGLRLIDGKMSFRELQALSEIEQQMLLFWCQGYFFEKAKSVVR